MFIFLSDGYLFLDVASAAENDFSEECFEETATVAAELHHARHNRQGGDFKTSGHRKGAAEHGKQICHQRQQPHPRHNRRQHSHGRHTCHKHGRKPMHEFQRVGIEQIKRDARHAEHIDLTAEQPHVYAPLVIDVGLANQRYRESSLAYARAHVDVFGKHLAESAHLLPHPA